jgi:hypothetical protein
MRPLLAALALALAACAAAPPPPPPPPRATPSLPVAAAPRGLASLRATAAMRMDGTLVDATVVAEANRQIATIAACGALVRATDGGVGSLNVDFAYAA